ncbi:MAG TPA: hypothetical protein VM512_01975 [Burkholderiaceae bacterium]|jgi:hypothetical protein|nr:hypothetical protein [Burkholderiaceae bacterium]
MAFIVLFALGILVVPLALDFSKHGKNNILRRSGRDLLEYQPVRRVLASLHVATERVSTVALSVSSLVAIAVVGYLGLKVIELFVEVASIFVK